jgi:hypothetical protein
MERERSGCSLALSHLTLTASARDSFFFFFFFFGFVFFPIFSWYDGTFYLSLNTCRTSGIPFITLWLKSTPSNRVRADGAFTEIVDGWMGVDLQPTRCPSAFDPFKFSVWLPFPRGKGMNENVLHDTRNCYYYYN